MVPSQPVDRVIKVGGSLYDLPDLRERLRSWLAMLTGRSLIVPGGGAMADVVRDFDRVHHLGEEAAHWLALGTLSLNAQFLGRLLEGFPGVTVLDPLEFIRKDEGSVDALPHLWDVTSDSIALRVKQVLGARELILLKSRPLPPGGDWQAASEAGLVDAYFPKRILPGELVHSLDFRHGISPARYY